MCRRSEGLSGRTLRKIPFLAHALFAQVIQLSQTKVSNPMTLLFDLDPHSDSGDVFGYAGEGSSGTVC